MKKNVIVLVGLFIVLLIAAFLVLQKPGEHSASSSSSGVLIAIDSLSVDKIEMKSPAAEIVLEKHDAGWNVVFPINCKANQVNICQIIHQLKNIEVKNIVSSKREKHALFQVDQSGTQVKVYEKGTEKASFVLGKMAADYVESYARRLNSDDVLLVEGANNYSFNRPVKDWRDKTVFTTLKENIKELQYQYGDTIFTVALKDSIWFIGKDKARQSVVDGILSSLSNFQADDFIDSTISPKIMAMVMYAGVQLRFSFNKTINKYYVQCSNSPQWFILESWKTDTILKRKKEIIEVNKKST